MRTFKFFLIMFGADPRLIMGASFRQLMTLLFLIFWSPFSLVISVVRHGAVELIGEMLWQRQLISYAEYEMRSLKIILSGAFVRFFFQHIAIIMPVMLILFMLAMGG